jgi:hypothetical protein
MRVVLWIIGIFVCGSIGAIGLLAASTYFGNNWAPPEMFASQLHDKKYPTRAALRTALTAILLEQFPISAPVSQVKSSLYSQGFREVASSPECNPDRTVCALRSDMRYLWAVGPVCGADIDVQWTIDEDARIVGIRANYYSACL